MYKKIMYRVYYAIGTLINVFWFHLRRVGRDKVPQDGPVILIANHQTLLDVAVIFAMTRRKVHFMAKKELFDNRFLGWALGTIDAFPISRGDADISGIRTALRILKEGGVLCIFPEGTRNKERKNEALLPLQDGVAMLALRGKAAVVPIWIEGGFHPFSRNVALCEGPMDLGAYAGTTRVDAQTMSKFTQDMRVALLKLRENALALL